MNHSFLRKQASPPHGHLSRASSRRSRRVSSRSARFPLPMLLPSFAPPSRKISRRRRALRAASTAAPRPSRSVRRAAAHRPGSKEAAAGMGVSAAHTTLVLRQLRQLRHHLPCSAAVLSSAAERCSMSTAVKLTSGRSVMGLPTCRSRGAASRLRAARPTMWSADTLVRAVIGSRQRLQYAGMLCVCRGERMRPSTAA